jgi:ABC-type Na+ transport system ATPase subunit NatA
LSSSEMRCSRSPSDCQMLLPLPLPLWTLFVAKVIGIDVTSAQLFRHLPAELAAAGKMILYISPVLETVEKTCAQVVIIYKGEIRALSR